LTPQAKSAGVSLILEAAGAGSITVLGDGDRLAQVFTNLLDNAVAHTPAGGQVTISARAVVDAPQAVEVTVIDTGAGIPQKELARIFERFYQVDKSRRRSRGVGLGLAISREIVEAHGGEITAESVVGTGSRFTVRLPIFPPSSPSRL
jgi:two-component system sensor histidine kinase ResE